MTLTKYNHKKFYRIQLYSTNVQAGGTWYNGSYNIDLNDFLPSGDAYQIAVESFNLSVSNNSLGYVIHLNNLSQPDTYSTLTSSSSYNILCFNGPNFYRFIDFSSIGCKLQDASFLSSKYLNIQFTDLTGTQLTNSYFPSIPNWVMSLVIFEIPKSEENN